MYQDASTLGHCLLKKIIVEWKCVLKYVPLSEVKTTGVLIDFKTDCLYVFYNCFQLVVNFEGMVEIDDDICMMA